MLQQHARSFIARISIRNVRLHHQMDMRTPRRITARENRQEFRRALKVRIHNPLQKGSFVSSSIKLLAR